MLEAALEVIKLDLLSLTRSARRALVSPLGASVTGTVPDGRGSFKHWCSSYAS